MTKDRDGDCRMEPGSFPAIRLFLTVTKEYAQGVKTLCDPRAQREGSSRRSRTPSGGEGAADVFPEELPGMPRKGNWSLP